MVPWSAPVSAPTPVVDVEIDDHLRRDQAIPPYNLQTYRNEQMYSQRPSVTSMVNPLLPGTSK